MFAEDNNTLGQASHTGLARQTQHASKLQLTVDSDRFSFENEGRSGENAPLWHSKISASFSTPCEKPANF